MKKIAIALFIVLSCVVAHAQDYCNTSRFDTTDVFTKGQIAIDTVVYGYNIDWQGHGDSLKLEVFYPKNSVDPLARRPVIMLTHGGGFVNGNLGGMRSNALYFARKGFVAFTIDYRLGWNQVCVPNNTSNVKAVYRANQDGRAAMRYMMAHASAYKIDTSKVFLFGKSAGAVNSLVMHFATEADFDAILPGIADSLGGLNTSTNALTTPFSIKGIATVSGGLFDLSSITSQNMIPLQMFHGVQDVVVPYRTDHPYGCTEFPEISGSFDIANRLRQLGGCFELCFDPDAGHGDVYDGEENFIYKRISHAFKRVLCDDCRQIVYRNKTLISDQSFSLIASAEEEEGENSPLSLYPNPCRDMVTISGVAARSVRLINDRGEVVAKADGAVTTIDMSGYAQGAYLLVVTDAAGSTFTRRLMKLEGR